MSGALASSALNEADLAAGRYDAAGVEIWLVNWSEPELRVLLRQGLARRGQARGRSVHRRGARLAH